MQWLMDFWHHHTISCTAFALLTLIMIEHTVHTLRMRRRPR